MSQHLLYFAYGSNLHPERLARRVPSARLVRPAALAGWRLAFRKRSADGSGKCDIVATGDRGDRVLGALFVLAAAERPLLDRCEVGYAVHHLAGDRLEPHGPARGLGPRRIEAQEGSPAFTYVATPDAVAEGLAPFDWYREMVVAGARHLRLPDEYVEEIAATAATADPDPARRSANLEVLRAMGAAPGGASRDHDQPMPRRPRRPRRRRR